MSSDEESLQHAKTLLAAYEEDKEMFGWVEEDYKRVEDLKELIKKLEEKLKI